MPLSYVEKQRIQFFHLIAIITAKVQQDTAYFFNIRFVSDILTTMHN